MNPLLTVFDTPFETPTFNLIKNEHFKPAIISLIESSRVEIDQIISNAEPASFHNTVEALEGTGRRLDEVSEIFFNLNSAETSDVLQQLAAEISPILTEFNNEIMQNPGLFARVKSVYDQKEKLNLEGESVMLLIKTYKGFIRSGANLSGKDKDRFKEISMELSKSTLKFGENVLAETNSFKLILARPSP